MPVSIQDCWPVSWTSCERRFLPLGICAEAASCASCLAETCGGGDAAFSRTSCAWRGFGKAIAASKHPRMNGRILMKGRIIGAAIPRKARQHLHSKQMPRHTASVVHIVSAFQNEGQR